MMHLLAPQLLKTLRVKCISQYSLCVHFIVIGLELRPAVHCDLSTLNSIIYRRDV